MKSEKSKLIALVIFGMTLFNSNLNFAVAQNPVISKHIVTDQFGYRPSSKKIAVIRDPQMGFDSLESYNPGSRYALVNKTTGEQVFTGQPAKWNNGNTDTSSGDKVWWFDFSSVTAPGEYYVLDVDSNRCSFTFKIANDVYSEVLRQACRTFFYQRAGFPKQPPFADQAWADAASHLQDKTARDFLDKGNASTQRDVSGGWYDAGDYNKYTRWTADYVMDFMQAFIAVPGVWGDDWNIPESGNHIPDILDEAKWGIDHLRRLQQPDGSLLSVVGAAHASPPSSAKGTTWYGRPNTSGTMNAAAAFALASKVYRSAGMKAYADTLLQTAKKAWNWADANPNVIFQNNTGNTSGLAAGQQETDDYGRLMAKMKAAAYLFEITGETKYKSFFESNYNNVHLMQWTFAYPFETSNQEILLYYTSLNGITANVATNIKNKYRSAMDGGDNFQAHTTKKDPYMAYMKDYVWGSNSTKARQGLMFTELVRYGVNTAKNALASEAAETYIHYIHGVNPLNLVYLSNMYAFGAENTVNEFYHSWFTNGSTKWDRVGTSTYGPAPGFLTGGPNPGYDWNGCCPGGCGSSSNNAICLSESIAPPKGQPKQKSYKDFNTSWPLDSWSVTENSCGYQTSYIRLLASFTPAAYDCSGLLNGGASYDVCGVCAGGNTGILPETDGGKCITAITDQSVPSPRIFPNPANEFLNIQLHANAEFHVKILNTSGMVLLEKTSEMNIQLPVKNLATGTYIVVITDNNQIWQKKFIKQ